MMAKSNSDCAENSGWDRRVRALSLFFAVSLVLPFAARAQLGASPDMMGKIYGPVFRHNARIWHGAIYDTNVMDGDIYRKGDVFVRAAFRHDKVELLEFCAVNRALSQKDVDAFLLISGEGSRWEIGADSTVAAKFYRRVDGGAIAHWATGDNGSLLISAERTDRLADKLL